MQSNPHDIYENEKELMKILGKGPLSDSDLKRCKEIIDKEGFDPNYKNNAGLTPLCLTSDPKIAQLLIDRGAGLDIDKNQLENGLLYYAIINENDDIVNSLIKHGKDHKIDSLSVNYQISFSRSLLDVLLSSSNRNFIQRFFNDFAASVSDEKWEKFIENISQPNEKHTQQLGLQNLVPLIGYLKNQSPPNEKLLAKLSKQKNSLIKSHTKSDNQKKRLAKDVNSEIESCRMGKSRLKIFEYRNEKLESLSLSSSLPQSTFLVASASPAKSGAATHGRREG